MSWYRFRIPRLFLSWSALVTLLSMAPGELKQAMGTTGLMHMPGHFLVFAVTALLLCSDVRSVQGRLLCAMAAAALGGALEFAEHLHFGCLFEWDDFMTDTAGAFAGALWASSLKSAIVHRIGTMLSTRSLAQQP